jgi:hypothetical protein
MRKSHITFIISIVLTFLSCNNSTKKAEITTSNLDSLKDSKKTSQQILKSESTTENEDIVEDTITDIKFRELSISINRLLIFDEEKKLNQIQKDTVNIYAELGETIENQKIEILSEQITDLSIEQRFETSITISNEGPHCDLTEWKHFYSEWKHLTKNENGVFICDKYSEKDYSNFPKVKIEELKKEVKRECGEEMYKLISKNKKVIENNCEVGISRYFLRIKGKNKENGQIVTKLIIIETSMGC